MRGSRQPLVSAHIGNSFCLRSYPTSVITNAMSVPFLSSLYSVAQIETLRHYSHVEIHSKKILFTREIRQNLCFALELWNLMDIYLVDVKTSQSLLNFTSSASRQILITYYIFQLHISSDSPPTLFCRMDQI